jgi:hypothetical protein
MKITKSKLMRIIKEEYSRLEKEDGRSDVEKITSVVRSSAEAGSSLEDMPQALESAGFRASVASPISRVQVETAEGMITIIRIDEFDHLDAVAPYAIGRTRK